MKTVAFFSLTVSALILTCRAEEFTLVLRSEKVMDTTEFEYLNLGPENQREMRSELGPNFFRELPAANKKAMIVLEEVLFGAMTRTAVSPDGRHFACCNSTPPWLTKIWSMEDVQVVALLRGHTAAIKEIVYSPDGGQIATCSDDRTIRVWNAADGTELASFAHNKANPKSLAFDGTGLWLASGGGDNTVRLWNLKTRNQGKVYKCPGSPTDVDITTDGSMTAAAVSNSVVVWRKSSSQELVRRTPGAYHKIKFFPGSGKLLIIGTTKPEPVVLTRKAFAEVWDVESDKVLCSIDLPTGPPNTLVIPEPGRIVFMGLNGIKSKQSIWDVVTK